MNKGSNRVFRYQLRYMSYGSWLAEWMYGFIMVAVVVGMINGYSHVALHLFRTEITIWLIVVTFGVNIAWGLIDGFTVIYGGLTDEADQEKIIGSLKNDKDNPEKRAKLLDMIEDKLGFLSEGEKNRLADDVIEKGPEFKKRYKLSNEDWHTLLAIASCDILAVLPVILPFIVFGFEPLAITLSRLIAATAIGWIVYKYAEHTGRRKWMAAGVFFILTILLMVVTWYYAW